ncbi:MAG TPA: IPT/TIG domain-containing protein [Thermoanaerobaculia bacterium]
MKRTLFALLVSLGAFAQPAPVIESITPTSGPDTGGTLVVIRGTNLNPTLACLLPCPSQVVFGDVAVDAVDVSPKELHVTTPPHAAGTVDVTVGVLGRPPVVVEDGFTFVEGPESRYERVLLPIYFKDKVPGAYGAQWATDLWIHNGGNLPVQIADVVCPRGLACPPVIPLTLPLEPGRSLHNPSQFFTENRNNPSLVLYLSGPGAKGVSMGLRVADTSRNAVNGGTDLPVIRESELLTGEAQLLNVPLDSRNYRLLLRLYHMSSNEAEYAVRFYAASEDAVPPILGTTLSAKTPRQGPFRSEAAYAELDITQLLNLRLAWPEVARIEIEPLAAASRYWAFVSLTNNETQLVTLVTPQ